MIDIDDRIDKLFPAGTAEVPFEIDYKCRRDIKDLITDVLGHVEKHFRELDPTTPLPTNSPKDSVLHELRTVRKELGL